MSQFIRSVDPVPEKPYWIDHCGHDIYVGSFQIYDTTTFKFSDYDVYISEDSFGDGLCIRYGNEGHEYMSPRIQDVFWHRESREYEGARDLLLTRGRLKWERRQ